MLTTFILVVHTLIAIALVGVILIQRSEGGGLGIGTGPAGLVTARGAANLLTRATTILAVAFITTSITLAVLAGYNRKTHAIDPTLAPATRPASTPAPVLDSPLGALPGDNGVTAPDKPVEAPKTNDVPLAQ